MWYVTLVIDGYDEVFTLMYPGRFETSIVEAYARAELARAQDESPRHVHVSTLELKDLP